MTAAELIAVAAFYDGKYAQAFPFFGVERRGAPVEAYCRLDEKFIQIREQVRQPDFILIQDASLIEGVDIVGGCKKDTVLVVNSEKAPCDLKGLPSKLKIQTIPATQIALDTIGQPIVNTALVGAFAGMSQLVSLASIKRACQERWQGEILKKNLMAVEFAYKHCCEHVDFCYDKKGANGTVKIDDKGKFGVNI